MSARLKKLTALALSCVMLVGATNMQVSAAITYVKAPSVTGTLAGTTASGRVSYNSTSATAVTSYSRSGASINVSAYVYYWFSKRYYVSYVSGSTTAGGISRTATKKLGGADVLGAEGDHYIYYNGVPWGTYITQSGTCKSDSAYIPG